VVVKSGIDSAWLSSVVMATPDPMPARATPIGRPMARIEPNDTMRMKMAKVRPSVSDDGGLNLEKGSPPYSIVRPGTFGAAFSMSLATDWISPCDSWRGKSTCA
jgi:hypothetical protein